MSASSHRLPVLDDLQAIERLDPEGMLAKAEAFAAQCAEGLRLGDAVILPDGFRAPANIVVAGMGGSAISGDLLGAIFADTLSTPLTVVRDYALPAFVGSSTLVFAVSHSGNTAETLSALDDAARRNARIICVCSGGKMQKKASAAGYPCVLVPPGKRPRANTGYLLMPMVAIVERLGLVKPDSAARREALSVLRRQEKELNRKVPTRRNPAKRLACGLRDRFPFIYAAVPWLGPVAFRWRTQLNENSKALALSHELPELDHNEVVGWRCGAGTVRAPIWVVLRPSHAKRETLDRVRFTETVIEGRITRHTIAARGKSRLSQVLSLVHFGDMVSLYLAFLNGVNPADTAPIDRLKALMASRGRRR